MSEPKWTSSEVLAFTERDGPGQPPPAPRRWTALTLAGTLGVVFTAVMFTDTLCPEHRAWVNSLAVIALATSIVAIVGLLRDWAGATLLTTFAASLGVSMGLIDTLHSPTRGRFVALAFGVVTVIAALLSTHAIRLWRWDRRMHRTLRPLDATAAARPMPTVAEPAPPVAPSMPAPPRAEQAVHSDS
jgi:hypothetical protein